MEKSRNCQEKKINSEVLYSARLCSDRLYLLPKTDRNIYILRYILHLRYILRLIISSCELLKKKLKIHRLNVETTDLSQTLLF